MTLTREWVEEHLEYCEANGKDASAELCRHWLATQPAESELQSCKEANGCPTGIGGATTLLDRASKLHANRSPRIYPRPRQKGNHTVTITPEESTT